MMKAVPFLLALVLPASARINDTEDQLVGRYGPVVARNGEELVFSRNGMGVTATIVGGKCQWIRFAKDAAPGATPQPLAPDQLRSLFEVNKDGLEWKLADDGSFRSSDGKRQALVSNGTLVIQTVDFLKHAAANKGSEEAAKTSPPIAEGGPPPTRVDIMAKSTSAGAARDKKWSTWWGSYDKEIFRERVISISLRASTPGNAIVETHWIGEEIETNSGNKVLEVTREPVMIPQGQPTVIEMGNLFVENDTKFAALGIRERKGIKYAGWVVRVVDASGNVLAVQATRPPMIDMVK